MSGTNDAAVPPSAGEGGTAPVSEEAGPIDAAEIAAAQLEFYRQRPALVAHGLARHAERIANLGLLP